VRPARFSDLRAFVRVDGWVCKADDPGRGTRKREVWTRGLADGTTLRAVISTGCGEYSPRMTAWILKHELRATENEFWAAVRGGRAPARPGVQPARPRGRPLPMALVQRLLAAGFTLDDVRGLTPGEARRLLDGAEGRDRR
jgi:hypothetical protein